MGRSIRKEEHRKWLQENDQILQIRSCHRTLAGNYVRIELFEISFFVWKNATSMGRLAFRWATAGLPIVTLSWAILAQNAEWLPQRRRINRPSGGSIRYIPYSSWSCLSDYHWDKPYFVQNFFVQNDLKWFIVGIILNCYLFHSIPFRSVWSSNARRRHILWKSNWTVEASKTKSTGFANIWKSQCQWAKSLPKMKWSIPLESPRVKVSRVLQPVGTQRNCHAKHTRVCVKSLVSVLGIQVVSRSPLHVLDKRVTIIVPWPTRRSTVLVPESTPRMAR